MARFVPCSTIQTACLLAPVLSFCLSESPLCLACALPLPDAHGMQRRQPVCLSVCTLTHTSSIHPSTTRRTSPPRPDVAPAHAVHCYAFSRCLSTLSLCLCLCLSFSLPDRTTDRPYSRSRTHHNAPPTASQPASHPYLLSQTYLRFTRRSVHPRHTAHSHSECPPPAKPTHTTSIYFPICLSSYVRNAAAILAHLSSAAPLSLLQGGWVVSPCPVVLSQRLWRLSCGLSLWLPWLEGLVWCGWLVCAVWAWEAAPPPTPTPPTDGKEGEYGDEWLDWGCGWAAPMSVSIGVKKRDRAWTGEASPTLLPVAVRSCGCGEEDPPTLVLCRLGASQPLE
mmetsp:Transcript_6404/g.15447  ORF Transcript_6404/g.15447 Transcript_6404/m.15447 type:complete len:337 (+) Transcript_6404:458-1468(+)